MALQLGDAYQEYYGSSSQQISLLFTQGKTPLSISDIMQRRLDVRNIPSLKPFHDTWWDNYIHTCDLLVYDPQSQSGKILIYDPQVKELLHQIDLEKYVVHNTLFLPAYLTKHLPGLKLSEHDIRQLHGKNYTLNEAKQSLVWQYLARSQERLEAYVDAVAQETDSTASLMPLYFGGSSIFSTAQLWSLSSHACNSSAKSLFDLENMYLRLIGI